MNITALLGLVLLLPAANRIQPDHLPALLEVAEQAGTFKTLVAAVGAAGLTEALSGDGPLTVFAPTDDAFARLPAGTVEDLLRPERQADLVAILTYHVTPGTVTGVDALRAGEAISLQGETLLFRLEGGALRVNDASVIANDIEARNGVIHVIDEVLIPPTPTPVNPALELIRGAIDSGAPLYNDGQREACAAIYETTAKAVVAMGHSSVPAEAVERLATALDESAKLSSATDRAWALRYGLDDAARILMDLEVGDRPNAGAEVSPSEKVLFDFGSDAKGWPSVNDNVMGGISRGGSRLSGNGTVLFLGELSLDNNGGFSTVRSPEQDLDLSGWDGLLLRVRGDGRTYNLSALRNDRRNELNFFQQPFETVAEEWIEVRVPFDQLAHRVMGWVRPNSRIAPAEIRSLSFGISDKSTLPFALEIDWIKAYRDM